MSSTPQVDSTDDRQPVMEGPDETGGLTASIMNRTHWMQRALSPWVKRWLSTTEGTSGRSGRPHPFTSLIVANTQRTLDRLRVQYESHSNLETLADSSLPLAGTVEKQASAPVTEAAVPAKSRRAQGPYAKPFQSMEDFVRSIAAAKERNYAPPSPDELQSRPEPKHTVGPYSRPFQSVEEFMRAVEAAKERNYAPPDEPQPRPEPKREAGKYSRAFSSFEDFVKAVEETRSQWGQVAEEAPSVEDVEPSLPSEPPASMPARVRPMSRIEELPVRAETRAVSSPIEMPAPPEISRPTPPPQPAPVAKPAATQAQHKAAPAAAPQPAAASAGPQIQRSPLEASSASSMPEDEVEPSVQRSVTPTLQRMEAPAQAEPEDLAASDTAGPAATPELDQVVQRLSQPTESHVNRPVDMPLVQRQVAASEAPEEISSEEEEPIEAGQPVVQRQPAVNLATPLSEVEEPSAQTEEPVVQRQVASPVQPEPVAGPVARAAMPLVQRRAVEDETEPEEPEEPEEQSAPVVQRQIAEAESGSLPASVHQPPAASAQSQPTTLQRRSDVTVPPPGDHPITPSADLASPRSANLPLVQRQPATPEPAPSVEPLFEAPIDLPAASPPSVVPLQTKAQAEARPASVDRPLVQRQKSDTTSTALPPMVQREAVETPEPTDELDTTEEAVQRSVDLSAPAPDQPLVQRRTAEVAPRPQAVQSSEKKIVAPLADAQSPAAHIEMPLVQRQTAEPELEPPDLGTAEIAPTAETVSADEVVPMEDTDTAETLQRKSTTETSPRKVMSPAIKPAALRVQRHTAEPIEPMDDETPASPPAQLDTRAPLEMPFVQRQPLEGKPAATPSQPTVVQRSAAPGEPEAETTTAQPVGDLSERILSRVAPPEHRAAVKPAELPLHHPVVQRESLPEAMTSEQAVGSERVSTPFTSSPAPVGAAPVIQRAAEPVIQRTAAESETSSPGTGFIQRVESVPPATEPEAEAAEAVDLDNLARQVYPLIKRMIAVERERRAFR